MTYGNYWWPLCMQIRGPDTTSRLRLASREEKEEKDMGGATKASIPKGQTFGKFRRVG